MCGRVFTDKSSKFEWHTAHV